MQRREMLKVIASPYRESAGANPVQSLLYDAMEKSGVKVTGYSRHKLLFDSWNVWHLHWPAEYTVSGRSNYSIVRRLLSFWLALKIARFKNTKVFWTVHNIRPHERKHPVLERMFWRLFLPNVDGIICQSESGKATLFREHPRAQSLPVFTIPHGHYRGVYPDGMDKGQARAALDIRPDDFVAVFLGQIRPYKGVNQLISSFTDARLSHSKLLVAGTATEGVKRELTELSRHNPQVRLFLEFVSHQDIQKYLRAADIVILPFTEILNSGSAILALSFDRPILVPASGALAELRETVGADWVRLYDGVIDAKIIESAARWTKSRAIRPDERAPLDALSWDGIAERTIQAFLQCLAAETPRLPAKLRAREAGSKASSQSRLGGRPS